MILEKRIAVYDPEFKEFGHNIWFNIHVLKILSPLFKEVYYFDFNKKVEKHFTDIPVNVKIIQLPTSLRNVKESMTKAKTLVKRKIDKLFNLIEGKIISGKTMRKSNFYNQTWEFIDKYNCNLLFLLSEGSKYRNFLYTSRPRIPYILLVHIVWSILNTLNNKHIGRDVKEFLKNSEGLFVLEDFLAPLLTHCNKNVYRFPLAVFEDNHTIPRKKETQPLKIGTVGVINERRNTDFILKTLSSYKGDTLEYYLYGKPLGEAGEKVVKAFQKCTFPGNVRVITHFDYLSDEEYDRIVEKCDFMVVAFDEKRKNQGSGGIYRFTGKFTPMIVPRIEPFVTIEKSYKHLFLFYDNLSSTSLNELLAVLAKKGNEYKDFKTNTAAAMRKFISFNKRTTQIKNVEKAFKGVFENMVEESPAINGTHFNRVFFFPPFNTLESLNDQAARASWYLGCLQAEKIFFPIGPGINIDHGYEFKVPGYLDEAVTQCYEKIKPKIVFINTGNETDSHYLETFDQSKIIMLWKLDEYPSESWKKKIEKIRQDKNRQVWRVDRFKERFEGSFYIKVGLEIRNYPGMEKEIQENKRKFMKMAEEIGSVPRAYVFGTGPMVAKYKEFDYSDGLSIICNSIIFDEELLEYVKPRILTFGDAIFHFGISQYAAAFRKRLTEVLQNHNLYIVIPFNFYRLFTWHFPRYKDITIAVPFAYDKTINLNLLDKFYLYPAGNILQMLMLPIACTFAEEINILGCDGRKKMDDSYFWSHNPNTQINDKMENIKESHPGFFNIDYNEYYDSHLDNLNHYLAALVKSRKTYQTLTPSYISLLRERYFYRNKPYENDFYPLVSIIVICSGDVNAIRAAVQSVTTQAYENWELIIVIEEDNRELIEAIDQLSERDKRIKVFHDVHPKIAKTRGGPTAYARNVGIKKAKGKYIAFLDDGDIYFPGSLKQRMESLVTNGYDAVFCASKLLGEDLKELSLIPAARDYMTFLDVHASQLPFRLSSLIVSKQCLEEVGMFDEGMPNYEAWDLIQRLARAGIVFWNVEKAAVGYREKANALSPMDHKSLFEGISKVLDIFYTEDQRVKKPVEEYQYGIGHARKLLMKNKNRFQLFIREVVKGNLEEAEELASGLSPRILLDIRNEEIIDWIKNSIVRHYECPQEDWGKYFFMHKKNFTRIFSLNRTNFSFNIFDLFTKMETLEKNTKPGNINGNREIVHLKAEINKLNQVIKNRDKALENFKEMLAKKGLMIENRDRAIQELKKKVSSQNTGGKRKSKVIQEGKKILKFIQGKRRK